MDLVNDQNRRNIVIHGLWSESVMIIYANQPETMLRSRARRSARRTNHVLMGTWLEVLAETEDWYEVKPRSNRGNGGWVLKSDTRADPILKVFFVDVGQGDGAIVEGPQGRILIDGGPTKKYHEFLKHRYKPLIDNGEAVHFDAVVVSHHDMDHFQGLTHTLNDSNFTFGTVYHNGIIRFDDESESGSPFDLGNLNSEGTILKNTFDTLSQADNLIDEGELMPTFRKFWEAAIRAKSEGRLKKSKRITVRDELLPDFDGDGNGNLRVEILGPVPTSSSGRVQYNTFPDPHDHPSTTPSSSHTRNGHSIVLKIVFGEHSVLFGGDLNIPAENHLLNYYAGENPFRVTVAKSCHHGSSDFSVKYLKKVKPRVNVVSSGDNKSFDHPTADAIGCASRWTTGDFPLFFSTELARAQSRSTLHYGLINVRSNGEGMVCAQMKEQHKRKPDVWDSFTVPWKGKFPDAL